MPRRGGGEYGTEWRNAGSRSNKQNVFDDFQACAEHLIAERYCSPSTLSIQVRHNLLHGGLSSMLSLLSFLSCGELEEAQCPLPKLDAIRASTGKSSDCLHTR